MAEKLQAKRDKDAEAVLKKDRGIATRIEEE